MASRDTSATKFSGMPSRILTFFEVNNKVGLNWFKNKISYNSSQKVHSISNSSRGGCAEEEQTGKIPEGNIDLWCIKYGDHEPVKILAKTFGGSVMMQAVQLKEPLTMGSPFQDTDAIMNAMFI